MKLSVLSAHMRHMLGDKDADTGGFLLLAVSSGEGASLIQTFFKSRTGPASQLALKEERRCRMQIYAD